MAWMKTLSDAVRWRWILPNQARQIGVSVMKLVGLPDRPLAGQVPGGDQFYVRLTEIPITEASVQANIDVMAARAAVTGGETNKPGNGKWVLPDASATRAALAPRSPGAGAPSGGGGSQPPQRPLPPGPKPALPAPGKELIARRFKRYFQDLQTETLRAMRARQRQLWDEEQALSRAKSILLEGLEAGGLDLDPAELEERAAQIEASVLAKVKRAVKADNPTEAVRQVFKEAIEQRAVAIAQEIYEELAA